MVSCEDANLLKQQKERAEQISFRIKPVKESSNQKEGAPLKVENTSELEFVSDTNEVSKLELVSDTIEAGEVEVVSYISEQTQTIELESIQVNKEPNLTEEIQLIALEDAIEKGKLLLSEIHMQIQTIYNEHFSNSAFAYSLNDVANDVEKYMQALLILRASTGKELCEKELDFIWAVLSRANIFEGTNSLDEVLDKANIITRVNPHAVLLTVAVDKFYKKSETDKLLTKIYDLYLLSCSLVKTNIIDKKQLLEAQIKFAQAQGVNIND